MLTLLDLRGDGCARVGAPTDAVNAGNQAAGRAFASAVQAEHADVEGLLCASRLNGEDVFAVFNRGLGKLEVAETGMLMDRPDLADVLERHGIGLVEYPRNRSAANPLLHEEVVLEEEKSF